MDKLRKNKRSGFTLVELLVVLVIIGIIVAIILPNTLRAIDQAERRQSAGVLRTITNACYLCYSQTRSWASCDTLAELSAGSYMDSSITTLTDFNGNSFAQPVSGPATGGGFQANTSIFPSWPNI